VTAVDAARLQFALLAGIHFLFVLVTLGLGPVVAIFQTRWACTGREVFERATRFWGQLYLINYALGIAAGIVLELQLGLHFPGLLDVAGGVFGAPLVIETMAAFFLESTFLGLWVFGWHVLPRAVHTAVFWLVVLTGYLSAFTVMVANGFLRNPVGFELVDGVARITDARALIMNPAAFLSSMHVLGACLVAGGFLLVGVGAWHLRRSSSRLPVVVDAGLPGDAMSQENALWRLSVRSGIVTGTVGAVLAAGFGFAQFSYVDAEASTSQAPGVVGSAYALMIAFANVVTLGGLVLLLLLAGNALFRMRRGVRNGLYSVLTFLLPAPFVVGILGWVAREVGRQPWAIAGVLRTEDAVGDASLTAVVTSLVVLVGTMLALAVADWTVLTRLARRGDARLVLGAPPSEVLSGAAEPEPVLTFGGVR